MTRLENLCYDPKWISKYLPKIIWYLPLVDSSMWHFHVTIFVALNSGRQNSTFTFFEVVNFLDCIFHVVFVVLICLSLYVSLTIKIVELIQLSNSIWNFLHSAHPIQVFIHPCGIGEYWLFLVFALLVGSERFGSTLHYFIVLIILFFFIFHLVFPTLRAESFRVTFRSHILTCSNWGGQYYRCGYPPLGLNFCVKSFALLPAFTFILKAVDVAMIFILLLFLINFTNLPRFSLLPERSSLCGHYVAYFSE